jgi:hypothetical protein
LHGGIEFRARVANSGGTDLVKIEFRGIAFSPFQLNRKDLLALRLAGQIDEEKLIKPALADQL